MSKERFGVVVVSKGKFIVVEGLDGCGKSTQIELISKKLKAMGKLVYITAEPTNYETGAYLRRILSESIDKDMYLQGALFLADRIEHITHPEFGIKKYLDQGYHVICDRYYFSTFAYQGTACDLDWVMQINLGCRQILKPDLCVFLDVDPNTCKRRIDEVREKPELYEQDVEKMKQIRSKFMTVFDILKDTHNIAIIDANAEINEISDNIFAEIQKVL